MAADERMWRIGEVATATGLTVRALHHYDQIGLVAPSVRTSGGHRLYTSADLVLLYDELDLPFGSLRVRPRGRSAGHNGVDSLIAALGTQEITRVRMGVGPDHPVGDGARYVLSQFKKAQLAVVDQVLDEAAEAVKVILADGVQAAMNRFNRKPEDASD